jgi:hypothetical protein
MGVFQDAKSLFLRSPGRKGIGGVHETVEVNASGENQWDRHHTCRKHGGSDIQNAAESVPQILKETDDKSDQRKKAKGIAHAFVIPDKLRHGNA